MRLTSCLPFQLVLVLPCALQYLTTYRLPTCLPTTSGCTGLTLRKQPHGKTPLAISLFSRAPPAHTLSPTVSARFPSSTPFVSTSVLSNCYHSCFFFPLFPPIISCARSLIFISQKLNLESCSPRFSRPLQFHFHPQWHLLIVVDPGSQRRISYSYSWFANKAPTTGFVFLSTCTIVLPSNAGSDSTRT